MANTQYIFSVRDSTISTGDNRKTGLTPKWVFMQGLNGTTVPSGTWPSIVEISGGQYGFQWNPDGQFGETTSQVDAGSGLVNGTDRYIDLLMGNAPSTISASGFYNLLTTAPSGQPTNFQQQMVMVFRRFFKKVTLDAYNNLITYDDTGSVPITTQVIGDSAQTRTSNSAG